MARIFLIITISLLLQACSTSNARTNKKEWVKNASKKNDKNGIAYEVVFEKENQLTINKKSSFFDNISTNFYSEYQISPDDELDVFLTTKVWGNDVDYEVLIGDTIIVSFKYASKYDVSPKIDEDGSILLPFIGKYNVSGKSTLVIQRDLIAMYGKVFRKPQLKVTLPDYLTKIRELRNEIRSPKRGLRRLVKVGNDGYSVFPLVGEYKVGGKTLNEVTKGLNAEYLKINPLLHAELFLK